MEPERFSFVHLDVDLKSSTRACLDFFYPRMLPGGIILTHDYSFLDGVRAAFREFLEDVSARLIEMPTSQALVLCQGVAEDIPPADPPGLRATRALTDLPAVSD